jgi:hypothetical protein
MHIYDIGYYSYEDSSYAQLTHSEKYTDEDLRGLVEEAVLAIVAVEKAREHGYVSTYDSIHHEVIEWLLTEKGFSKLELTATWNCFGWGSIFMKGDWSRYPDKNRAHLVDTLQAAGYTAEDDDHTSHLKERMEEIANERNTEA